MATFHELISVQDFIEQMSQSVPIGDNKLYALVKEPGFPSIKIGKRYYVLADKVNEWLEKQAGDSIQVREDHDEPSQGRIGEG